MLFPKLERPLWTPNFWLSTLFLGVEIFGPTTVAGPPGKKDTYRFEYCTFLEPRTAHLSLLPPSTAATDNANMKVAFLSIGLLALFSPLTAAWSKEGMPIFP